MVTVLACPGIATFPSLSPAVRASSFSSGAYSARRPDAPTAGLPFVISASRRAADGDAKANTLGGFSWPVRDYADCARRHRWLAAVLRDGRCKRARHFTIAMPIGVGAGCLSSMHRHSTPKFSSSRFAGFRELPSPAAVALAGWLMGAGRRRLAVGLILRRRSLGRTAY